MIPVSTHIATRREIWTPGNMEEIWTPKPAPPAGPVRVVDLPGIPNQPSRIHRVSQFDVTPFAFASRSEPASAVTYAWFFARAIAHQ